MLKREFIIINLYPPTLRNNGPKTIETIAISFRRIFKAGPLVSLVGSPTVSPMTPAS